MSFFQIATKEASGTQVPQLRDRCLVFVSIRTSQCTGPPTIQHYPQSHAVPTSGIFQPENHVNPG
jgi:hypothetical protein